MARNLGPIRFGKAERDDDGHRTLSIIFLVEGDIGSSNSLAGTDGPQRVTFASGLPRVGDSWAFGNDFDGWAYCTPYLGISPVQKDGEKNKFWELEYKFSTKPWVDSGGGGGGSGHSARLSWCNGVQIDNPLLEPYTIRGSFIHNTEKNTVHYSDFSGEDPPGDENNSDLQFQDPIQTTSFEPIEVERDNNLPQVEIGKNVLNLQLSTFANLVNTINNDTLWGMPKHTIKLSNVTWERRLYGLCFFYWHRTFIFDINSDTFNRGDIANYGKKVKLGHWELGVFDMPFWVPSVNADPTNPLDYVEFYDSRGNLSETWIDPTTGEPTDTPNYRTNSFSGDPDNKVRVYKQFNFLTLGIPTTIG